MQRADRIVEHIDFAGLLDTLTDLVAIPSLGGEPGEIAVQHHITELLQSWGCDVDAWDIDLVGLSTHPQYSAELDRSRGLGVVGSYGGDGPALVLNGHTDVVPAGDVANWRYEPWRATVDGGNVYGRGTVDMKGGLCCGLYALKAVIDSGVRLDGRVVVQAVIGEEDGGSGTLASVLRGHTGDGAIIMEPTSLEVATAQAGCFNFRVSVPGRAAHGAIRYEGVDAIEKFLPLYQAILDFERERNIGPHDPLFARYSSPYPIAVGTIRAGVWASTVAEELTFEGRYGIRIDENLAAARRDFEDTIAATARSDPWLAENPPTVTWWGGQFEPASTDHSSRIVGSVADAFEQVTATPANLVGVPFGADMRLLNNVGDTPTVMFGPGDVRMAHYADEFVPLEDLRVCTETLVRTIVDFCGIAD